MRVLFLGSYHRDADRNRILLRGLRECGVLVSEHRFPMEALKFRGGGFTMAARLLKAGVALPAYCTHMVSGAHMARCADAIFVGYLGHQDMGMLAMLRKMLSSLRGKPIVFDPFLSLYDTVVSDRELLVQGSLGTRLLWRAERWVFSIADVVLADTAAHAAYYRRMAGLPEERLRVVPVGVDETAFPVRDYRPSAGPLRILFYGTYIPLHGVETILRAADLLRGENVSLRLIGRGQTRPAADALARQLRLQNVRFVDWVPLEQLADEIAESDLVLGIFGTTGKAARVVPNKVYQALSVGRCVVTRESPALREMLVPGEHLAVCPAGNPEALADTIRELKLNARRRARLAQAGHRVVHQRFTAPVVGRLLRRILTEAVPSRSS